MQPYSDAILQHIGNELLTIFAAHRAVGLKGKMCLFTHPAQETWRSSEGGVQFWFDEAEIPQALERIRGYYRNGALPNATLLLNPVVHSVGADGSLKAEGSGVMWGTGFILGVSKLQQDQIERLRDIGALTSEFVRGENDRAGLKMLAFSNKALAANPDGLTATACRDLAHLAHIDSPEYAPYYLLSGLGYLAKHGLFQHPDFAKLLPQGADISTPEGREKLVREKAVDPQTIIDAAIAWDAYDHHDSLYRKFGSDTSQIERNLKFFNLCARDIALFDATGVKHMDASTSVGFEFLVDGWIPKGAVTVIGASGGTGKSSLAHNLAVKAARDYPEGTPNPSWLGSKVNTENAKGIIVYLSGEDGPAIVHSRAKVFDPNGESNRLMVMRTDFGEDPNLAAFLKRLSKLPEVSLVVIDPARKYLTGDEDDASVVSEFFEAIEEFAINRNSAMVVVHHLAKGAKPTHVSDIYDLLRGSQVFIDRPRVVIGMYREGPYVVAGLSKNNIPPQLGMVQGERIFARDADHLELVQLPGEAGSRIAANVTEEMLEQIRAAAEAS